MATFTMPALGADMDSGTLVEWRVKPGDQIRKGEIIAVVDTAKSAIEVESFHTGVVEELVADVGERLPVGAALATIAETAPQAVPEPGKPPRAKPEAAAKAAAKPEAAVAEPAGAAAGPARAARKPSLRAAAGRITPLVRRVAEQLGVDLAAVPGTGRGGAVTRADVERAAAEAVPREAAGAEAIPGRAVRGEAAPGEAGRGEVGRGEVGPAAAPARRRVSPLARRIAAELGVDLEAVSGTGPDGAVREEDVRRAARERAERPVAEAAAEAIGEEAGLARAAGPEAGPGGAVPAAPAPEREVAPRAAAQPAAARERLAAMRQATARLMARSKREIPHYYLTNTVDMTAAMTWLHERNRALSMSERLVPAALLLKATALAAREAPELNGYWQDEAFEPASAVHLGVAISLRGGGLVTPAIHDADGLPVGELMVRLRDLVGRARAGRLRRSELTEATITVTNLGDQGVESVTGVIYPPQVALAGFGKVMDRPWAVGGLLGVRPVVMSTLAADHRATDGYTGARFLATIDDLLQRPEGL